MSIILILLLKLKGHPCCGFRARSAEWSNSKAGMSHSASSPLPTTRNAARS